MAVTTPPTQEIEVVRSVVSEVVSEAVIASKESEKEKEIVLKTEEGTWTSADVADIAKFLSERKDLDDFESFFYPEGFTWLPPEILNLATKTLNKSQYEQIKSWVVAIKNKSREADKTLSARPKLEAEISTEAEPDWTTFPHLTSSDPRTAKNLTEEIKNAILTLTVSEGTNALYSRFNPGQVEWVSQHYLNDREKALLEQLKNCKQLDLFGGVFEEQSEEYLSDYQL